MLKNASEVNNWLKKFILLTLWRRPYSHLQIFVFLTNFESDRSTVLNCGVQNLILGFFWDEFLQKSWYFRTLDCKEWKKPMFTCYKCKQKSIVNFFKVTFSLQPTATLSWPSVYRSLSTQMIQSSIYMYFINNNVPFGYW